MYDLCGIERLEHARIPVLSMILKYNDYFPQVLH